MSSEKKLANTEFLGPVQDFVVFCSAERERRVNSGAPFDSNAFDKAVKLATKKLHALEGGEY